MGSMLDQRFFELIKRTDHKGSVLESYKAVYARSTMVLFSRKTRTPLAALTLKADDVGCLSMLTGRPAPVGASDPYFQGMLNMPDQTFTFTISNLSEDMINFNILHTPHRISVVNPGPSYGINEVNELHQNQSYTIPADQRNNRRMILTGKTTTIKDPETSNAKQVAVTVKQSEADPNKPTGLYFHLSVVPDLSCKSLVDKFAEGTVWKVSAGFVRHVARLPGFVRPGTMPDAGRPFRTRCMVSSARYQDTRPGIEPLSMPGQQPRHPGFIEEERSGAVLVPGIDSDGLTIEERYDEQSTIATHEEESTVDVIARRVDMEEESRRMRHELLHERDQLRQMLDNAPIVTPVVADFSLRECKSAKGQKHAARSASEVLTGLFGREASSPPKRGLFRAHAAPPMRDMSPPPTHRYLPSSERAYSAAEAIQPPREGTTKTAPCSTAEAHFVSPIDVGTTQAGALKYGEQVNVQSGYTGHDYAYEHSSEPAVLCMSIWEGMKFLALSSSVEEELAAEVTEWMENEGRALIASLNAIFKTEICVIDQESEADTIVCTCGHQCLNHANVRNELRKCPICRSPITAFVRADGIMLE